MIDSDLAVIERRLLEELAAGRILLTDLTPWWRRRVLVKVVDMLGDT